MRRPSLGSYLGPELVSGRRNLILQGKSGRGKTHLVVAIAYRAIQNGFTARFVTAAVLIESLSVASRQGKLQEQLAHYLQPHVLVIDEVGYLSYGPDAANVLFHIVNERHQRGRPMLFTTNKPPLTAWGDVLHDHDLAEAIVDRVLENGRLLLLDGPSYRTRHLDLPAEDTHDALHQPARISGNQSAEFPEPTPSICTPVRWLAVGCLRTSSGSCPGTTARRACRAPRPPRWSSAVPPEAVRYCGRLFSEQELQLIRTIIAEDSSRHRFALSQVVCERLHWRRANGQLKDMSCRVAMLRMHRDGLIPLPAPRRRHSNGTLHRRRTPQAEPELPIIARVDALPALQVRPLADQREAQLWREYVDRYHYLGYTPLPGAQMRYLVTSQRRVLAVVGFGASAWKAAPRDRFIGWSVAQREARLQLVVNNARFLILPWVQVRNLASTVLARSSRRLPDDCQARYGYRPLLLETFVQSDRFAGTSYRAANWTHVGQTQGRGKLDVHRTHALPRKDIWLYPLRRDFRRRLCAPLDPPPHQ